MLIERWSKGEILGPGTAVWFKSGAHASQLVRILPPFPWTSLLILYPFLEENVDNLPMKNYPFFKTWRRTLLQMTNLLYSLCNHVGEEEKDSSVWQKHDTPPTNHDMVEVKVDYPLGGLVEIPPFFENPWRSYFRNIPFLRNPWTMARTKKHPVSPWKCRLAWAPLLNWTAVTGILGKCS